jgi:hypothetical protein
MNRAFLFLAVAALSFAFTLKAAASIIISFDDPFDKREIVIDAMDDPRVKTFNDDLTAFKKKLLPLKLRDFEALFGKPVAKPVKEYAFPTAERRALGLSGLRYVDEKMNKDHTDFHVLGDLAGLEIWYGLDGETPAAIVVFFKVDKQFIPLDHPDRFVQRLGWDRDKYQKLVRYVEQRRAKVFVWEVDPDQSLEQYQETDALVFDQKIDAWIAWGKKEGLQLTHHVATETANSRWEWHDKSGKLVAAAFHDRGYRGAEAKPTQFARYHPNGTPCREEFGLGSLESIRWQTPEGKNIRYDSGRVVEGVWRGLGWTWWNHSDGAVRIEFDDNDDGIPDWVKQGSAEKEGKELKSERLTVEKSWAIHPDLIPKECRVPGQEVRQLHIRKIAMPPD